MQIFRAACLPRLWLSCSLTRYRPRTTDRSVSSPGTASLKARRFPPLASAVSSGFGSNLNFGGRVAFTIAPGFEAVGEVGRIGNVLPPLVSSILAFSPVDLRASPRMECRRKRHARLSRRPLGVNPHAEATGGGARLNCERASGLSATANDLLALGLAVTNRTSPMAGLGGGVVFHSGRLTMDAGYRYKKIFDRSFVTGLFGGGQSMTNHQVVFGAGVRF